MISVGENKAVICKGDFHPAMLYKSDKKISGYSVEEFEGEGGITLENCYNDKLHNAVIHGEVQSVGELVTEGEYAGKYRIPIRVRGKNLFEYTPECAYVQSGNVIEKTDVGAIARGNINSSAAVNSWARGWYTPGYLKGTCPILYTGDVVTISADVTLLELRQDEEFRIQVHFYSREQGGYSDGATTKVDLNETKRIKRTYTISEQRSGCTFYPCFVLNSNILKIENIQIEYGSSTPYEPYIEPQKHNIYLDEPLEKTENYYDYIDLDRGIAIRNENGTITEKIVDTPELPTFKGTTIYEIDTSIAATLSGKYKKLEVE